MKKKDPMHRKTNQRVVKQPTMPGSKAAPSEENSVLHGPSKIPQHKANIKRR